MTFQDVLRDATAPLAKAVAAAEHPRTGAAAVVALHAPHVLRRFAEMTAVLNEYPDIAGNIDITARRTKAMGFERVTLETQDLRIVLRVYDGSAILRWSAGGEPSERTLGPDTDTATLDADLLAAMRAYVRTHSEIAL